MTDTVQPVADVETYTCARCKGVFEFAWTDEEAKAEFERDFPGCTIEDAAMICDDCHKLIMGHTEGSA